MWWYSLILLPVAVAVWLLYEWFEHTAVQYKTTEVECQKMPYPNGLRLCLISDLHNNRKNLSRLIRQIQKNRPDVILLAGDLVNKHTEDNRRALSLLWAVSSLSVPVYYAAGNHELSLSQNKPEVWKQYLSEMPQGIHYLENASAFLDKECMVCISGLSLPKEFYKKGSLHKESGDLPEIHIPDNSFHILIAHHPEYADFYEKYNADFIVSGHLHGGLLRLPFFGGVLSPRLRFPKGFDSGFIRLPNGRHLFISRGLGSHTIPLRFFNRVEVNFLLLKETEDKK